MIIKYVISCFIACVAYGVLFNIHGKRLLVVGMVGALGTFAYEYAMLLSLPKVSAIFIAAIVIGICSEVMARLCKSPVTIFIVCAFIPLVPGGGMYHTMLYAIQGDVYQALFTCVDTITISFLLVLGTQVVSPLVRLIRNIYRKGKYHATN